MADAIAKVSVHRWRDVTILRLVDTDRWLWCLVRPEWVHRDMRGAVERLERIRSGTWFSRWRILRILRKFGKVWDEKFYDGGWSDELTLAISRSRDLLEELDLAGVGPLAPELRDEHDDIIFAVMAKIVVGDDNSLDSWVTMVYEIDSEAFDGAPIRRALQDVETELRRARCS